MVSLPEKGGISVQVMTDVSSQKKRLYIGNQSPGHFFLQEGVGDDISFSFLPLSENDFPSFPVQPDGAVFFQFEVFGRNHAVVHQGEGQAIGADASEFFHQVQRQGKAAWAVPVKEAGIGIQAGSF